MFYIKIVLIRKFKRIIYCRVYLHLDRNLPNRARNQSKRDRQLSNCFLHSRMLIVNHMVQHEHLDQHDFSPKNKVIRNLNHFFFSIRKTNLTINQSNRPCVGENNVGAKCVVIALSESVTIRCQIECANIAFSTFSVFTPD